MAKLGHKSLRQRPAPAGRQAPYRGVGRAQPRNSVKRPGWAVHTLLTSAVVLATSAFAADVIDPNALKRFVHQDCGSCHGLSLKGGLGPDLRSETLEHYDPEVLTGVILDGIPDTAMPPWRPLISEEEAEWIARYLLEQEEQ